VELGPYEIGIHHISPWKWYHGLHMSQTLVAVLVHYRYIAILPVAILEGPIISIFSGFLAAQGVVSFIPVFIIVFLGDFSSDAFFYFVGRRGREAAQRWIPRFTSNKLSVIEDEYKTRPWKTMFAAKASYGLGIVFMIAAGLARMSRKKFLGSMAALNAVRSFLLVSLGYYFGRLFLNTGTAYLTRYAVLVIIFVPALYIVGWNMRQREKRSERQKKRGLHH